LTGGGHGGRSGPCRPTVVRHGDAHGIGARRRVGVGGRNWTRLAARAAAGLGRPVTPIDAVRPGSVVDAVREGGVERDGAPRGDELIAARVHHGRYVCNRRRGGRRAGRCARVGNRERDGVAARAAVRVTRRDSGGAAAVTEAPGVAQWVPVRIGGAAPVEADGYALRTAVGAARRGGGRVIHA